MPGGLTPGISAVIKRHRAGDPNNCGDPSALFHDGLPSEITLFNKIADELASLVFVEKSSVVVKAGVSSQGRLAQRESIGLTSRGSQVQILYRPPSGKALGLCRGRSSAG